MIPRNRQCIAWGVAILVNLGIFHSLSWMNQLSAEKRQVREFYDTIDFNPEILRKPLPEQEAESPATVSEDAPPETALPGPEVPSLPKLGDMEFNADFESLETLPSFAMSQPDLSARVPPKTKNINPDRAFFINELDRPPKAVFQPMPDYPSAAIQLKIKGHFTVSFLIRQDGSVGEVEIVNRPARAGRMFDDNILKAVRQWVFDPGTRQGVKVKSRVSVIIQFDMFNL